MSTPTLTGNLNEHPIHVYRVFHDENDPGEIENATHNAFPKLTWIF
jgi:hypothetical protein